MKKFKSMSFGINEQLRHKMHSPYREHLFYYLLDMAELDPYMISNLYCLTEVCIVYIVPIIRPSLQNPYFNVFYPYSNKTSRDNM